MDCNYCDDHRMTMSCPRCGKGSCDNCPELDTLRKELAEVNAERDNMRNCPHIEKCSTEINDPRCKLCPKVLDDCMQGCEAERDRLRDALEELCDIIETAHEEGNYKDHIDSFTTQPARTAIREASE